jgi:hypothetical protein
MASKGRALPRWRSCSFTPLARHLAAFPTLLESRLSADGQYCRVSMALMV